MTAILHRGPRNDFFFISTNLLFQILSGLLFPFSLFAMNFYFPFSLWTFIFILRFFFGLFPLFSLDFFPLFSLDFYLIAVTFWISSKFFHLILIFCFHEPPKNNQLKGGHPVVQQSCANTAAGRWLAAAILSNEQT